MPTIRSTPAPTKTVADFTIAHRLQFAAGWLPERKLWPMRASYLSDYAKARGEFMKTWGRRPDRVPFAEKALRYLEQHGEAALATASDDTIRAAFSDAAHPNKSKRSIGRRA